MSEQRRQQRTYDHRLRGLVRETGDPTVATRLGVPRSTAAGWLRGGPQDVITLDVLAPRETRLQAEVLKLRRRIRTLGSIVSLLLTLLRVSGFRLEASPLPPGPVRTALLRAVQRAREWLPLRAVLVLAGISSSRLNAWKAVEGACPTDRTSCPRRTPNQLTAEEVFAIREMVTSTEYRHVPTSRLAILAQRLGKVFASPTTWARLVRERGWRRARQRVHPQQPKVGLRTTRPDAAWHIDTTVIRLLDGTKAYVFAVIDFSQRILSFRVADRFEIANTIAVLVEAACGAVGASGAQEEPMLVVDGGVENFNGSVDKLIKGGVLRRVLAMTEIEFSNSLIEAFWRTMKHQWLFLNTLDSVAALRRHVAFYVAAHNEQVSHSAFRGQTPDEMYFGTGEQIPVELASAKRAALEARLNANRMLSCDHCARLPVGANGDLSAAD
jgi:hypothetical protein